MKDRFQIGKQIIPAGFRKEVKEPVRYAPNSYLRIAEMFCDTIQGENFVGVPSTFIRLQGCTLDCIWCDSNMVWRQGNPFTFEEIFQYMEKFDLIRKFKEGQNLVITGGSPLKQQHALLTFFQHFLAEYKFLPYIEVENECTLNPLDELTAYISIWNNSPKLASSENPKELRYNPKVLKTLSELHCTYGVSGNAIQSWFKFVVGSYEDWQEIKEDFLDTGLIEKNQIVLMPLGATQEELKQTQQIAVEIAIRENVRYSPRLHVDLWNKKTGI